MTFSSRPKCRKAFEVFLQQLNSIRKKSEKMDDQTKVLIMREKEIRKMFSFYLQLPA